MLLVWMLVCVFAAIVSNLILHLIYAGALVGGDVLVAGSLLQFSLDSNYLPLSSSYHLILPRSALLSAVEQMTGVLKVSSDLCLSAR